MRRDETGSSRICVTNAKGGTGKTTVAINTDVFLEIARELDRQFDYAEVTA
jgi:cellulose biosynthesis protein BcsQ